MSTEKVNKINYLLQSQPKGVVFLNSWLRKNGYSLDLQRRYRKSNWFRSIGRGAMIRTGEKITYHGALHALQKQAGMSIHPGGKTALSILGKSHYLELSPKKVVLFGGTRESMPLWFQNYDWGVELNYYRSGFLPDNLGITEVENNGIELRVSNATRAIMECLYLVPQHQDLYECHELMGGLNNLRPREVQELLEACKSVKVNRLFLFLAERAGHNWFKYLDKSPIDMGEGKRSIVKGGVYVPKYQITVSKELELKNERSI